MEPKKAKPMHKSRTVWSALAFLIVFLASQFIEMPDNIEPIIHSVEAVLGTLSVYFMRDAVGKAAPLLLFSFIIVGCQSPKLDSVKQCLSRIQADYSDKTMVKVPDERVRESRLEMIKAAQKVVAEASK